MAVAVYFYAAYTLISKIPFVEDACSLYLTEEAIDLIKHFVLSILYMISPIAFVPIAFAFRASLGTALKIVA